MSTTSHITRRGALLVATLIALLFASAAPAHASYGWPVKPFHRQHAVRGYFGDPRIAGNDEAGGTFHFGIDISAANRTPVYATLDGIASIHPLHHDTVIVSAGGVTHEYWHVVPAIRPGERVYAYRTIVGRVEAPWGHVHFSESSGGVYLNPLRPGALAPYRDTTTPIVSHITLERDGTPAGTRVAGRIDFVAQAEDTLPLAPPKPWNDVPVTPALVEWKLVAARATASASAWHIAADYRSALPTVPFASVYARWTRQNHPDLRHRLGRYRFALARGFDTAALANGSYRLVVRVADTSGNASTSFRTFTVANGV